MNLARKPIKGSRCETQVLQPWVGLALCMDLVRSRHLHPITGSPGGVNRHAERGGRFGARLWDLIRCTRQPPTQLKLRECGSPRRLSQPERDFSNLRLCCGRLDGALPRVGTRRGHGRLLSFREGGHVPDSGLDLAGRSCPWLVYPRRLRDRPVEPALRSPTTGSCEVLTASLVTAVREPRPDSWNSRITDRRS